jgi:hypothetical protein
MVDKPEALFYQQLRKVLDRTPKLLYDRVENRVANGMPDLSITLSDGFSGGRHCWVELKVWHETKKLSHLTEVQKKWLFEHDLMAGNCWLLLKLEVARGSQHNAVAIPGWNIHNLPTYFPECPSKWVGQRRYESFLKVDGAVGLGEVSELNSAKIRSWLLKGTPHLTSSRAANVAGSE